jgi:ankyrin repeat protein
MAEALLRFGAKPNWTNLKKSTAMHMAIEQNRPHLVALLLKYGAIGDVRYVFLLYSLLFRFCWFFLLLLLLFSCCYATLFRKSRVALRLKYGAIDDVNYAVRMLL